MVQFYLPPDRWDSQIDSGTARLEGGEARHARDAFRLKPGDAIRIFDGRGSSARGRVKAATSSALDMTIERKLASDAEPRTHVDLAQALVPNETMDQIVRQAAELGVSRIWPVACDRSVVKLDADKRLAKVEHWKKTALAACKQCDRNTLPEVMPVLTARELTTKFSDYGATLIASPAESQAELDVWVKTPARPGRILIAIGPEGDFSPEELKLFAQSGVRAVTLGPLILKSDTAAVAALSVLQFLTRQLT